MVKECELTGGQGCVFSSVPRVKQAVFEHIFVSALRVYCKWSVYYLTDSDTEKFVKAF